MADISKITIPNGSGTNTYDLKDSEAREGLLSTVKYTKQTLTSAQQAQARENIGAAASTDIPTDAVKYTAQTLTNAQKSQARQNIGASDGDYRFLTNTPPLVKGSGTGGNLNGGTGMNSTTTTAKKNSIAYGDVASANGNYSAAFGYFVQALHDYEIAYGKLNQSNADTAFSIGNGADTQNRHNLMELKTDGTLLLNGNAVKTEGGDDNKLRLGQICGLTKNNYFEMGFADLFSETITGVTFLSSVASEDSFYLSCLAGDFLAYKTTSSGSSMVYVAPIPGRREDAIKTGAWILVENCYKMFKGANNTAFTSLDLSMFDTSECKNMAQMFYGCTKLTTLDLSSFDMTNVVAYTGMFGSGSYKAGITTLRCPKINPHDDIPLPRTLYSQDGTAYTNLPVTTGTSIELRQSWT